MNRTIDAIVSGHLCLDLIPAMERVPLAELATPGRYFESDALSIATGGAVSNTGLALHKLGLDVRLMSTVGDDALGRMIIDTVESHGPGLAEYFSVLPGQSSSYTIVLSPENVDRIFLHHTGTNVIFGEANINFSLLNSARLFHLGYPTTLPRLMVNNGDELVSIYRQAKATGVATSLDMALPNPDGESGKPDWAHILSRTLPYVDVFVPSIEEILFMLRRRDFDNWEGAVLSHLTGDYLADLAQEILDMGACIAGFKLGHLGIYLQANDAGHLDRLVQLPINPADWHQARVYHPAFAVKVAGTTGAGDAAYAGLLAALLWGLSPQDTVRWGCAVGACNVEAIDALSGVRSAAATRQRLESGWATRQDRIPGL